MKNLLLNIVREVLVNTSVVVAVEDFTTVEEVDASAEGIATTTNQTRGKIVVTFESKSVIKRSDQK